MDRADFMPILIAIPTMVVMVFVATIVYQFRDDILGYVKGFRTQRPQPAPRRRPVVLSPEMQQLMDELEHPPIMTSGRADAQTDAADGRDPTLARLQLDKTRMALIETLVTAGWDVVTIRGVIKGDNATIGTEVAAARERLQIAGPPRVIPSREHIDGHLVEREIVM